MTSEIADIGLLEGIAGFGMLAFVVGVLLASHYVNDHIDATTERDGDATGIAIVFLGLLVFGGIGSHLTTAYGFHPEAMMIGGISGMFGLLIALMIGALIRGVYRDITAYATT